MFSFWQKICATKCPNLRNGNCYLGNAQICTVFLCMGLPSWRNCTAALVVQGLDFLMMSVCSFVSCSYLMTTDVLEQQITKSSVVFPVCIPSFSDEDSKDFLVWGCLRRFHCCRSPDWQVLQGVAGFPHCHLRYHPSH